MKKINIESIIKILILLAFSTFYFKIIITNEIIMYVNPRIVPFVVLGMIAMIIIALFLIEDVYHNKKKKIKVRNYLIFIIPLIMILFTQGNSASSSTIKSSDINTKSISSSESNRDINSASGNDINQDSDLNNGSYEGATDTYTQDILDKKQLDIKDNVINVTSTNFIFTLDEILTSPEKYEGQYIEITGFVYKDESINDNEFIIGRYMMVCCAADIQIAGIRCESNSLESYDNDTWIKVKGKIKKDTSNGAVDAVIVVESLEKDLAPDTAYVYPY